MRASGAAADRRAATSLARSTPEDLTTAWASFTRLVATARAVAAAPQAGVVAPEPLLTLATRIAALPVIAVPAVGTAADLGSVFTCALDAVRVCRQVVHPRGVCWFTLDDGQDLCGEVLHAAHTLAVTRQDPA